MRVVDLFAGAGGVTSGAKRAGLNVVFAANHWKQAVDHHASRHPDVEHACQDLNQFDFRLMPPCDLIWASPACQGHSEAAQPARARDESIVMAHDELRTTAWAVVTAVLAAQPRAFVVENVPEFREWAPPKVKGRPPPEKGSLYRHWVNTFLLSGYRVTEQVLTASRWGVPQRRRRLILIGCLDREIHVSDPDVEEPPIGPVLDFEGGQSWKSISSIAKPGARGRAEHAQRTFGGRPCWGWHATHQKAWARGLEQPANTITTQNQHYLVRDGEYRLWTVGETAEAMDFDRDYFRGVPRTAAITMAGNAVPPSLAAGVLRRVAEAIA